jgi:hypothetical protein
LEMRSIGFGALTVTLSLVNDGRSTSSPSLRRDTID